MGKELKCLSTDRWMKKIVVHAYTYNGTLFSYEKKKEVLSFATIWMDLEGVMLSEMSQTEKDKYDMLSLTCRI